MVVGEVSHQHDPLENYLVVPFFTAVDQEPIQKNVEVVKTQDPDTQASSV